ncbi:AAA family ATPase [bacterium]|nr:AAA family ATPase [bacterium]
MPSPRHAPSDPPPASLPPPLVGRRREQDELAALARDLAAGRGGLALITGEAGIGKTRLADAAARAATQQGARVIWSRCWEAGGAPAFGPWHEVFRQLAAAAGAAAWRGWTAGLGDALAPLNADPGTPTAPPADAEAARFAVFDATSRLLRRATERPLLLIFEDLHAADLPSLRLLELIARELDDLPLAIIGTYRPQEAEQRPAAGLTLARLARAALRLPLAGLAIDDVAALLARGGAPAPLALAAVIHDATAGNPLFVVETTHALRRDHPNGLAGVTAQDLQLAPGIRDAVRARLAGLSPTCRALLELAAVFGDRVALGDLQRAAGVPLAAALDAAREGTAAGVLNDPALDHRLAFRHALLRAVLYQDLPPDRRGALHRAAGRALLERHALDPDPHLAALSHHFRAGADDPSTTAAALDLTLRAARRAAAQFADDEAIAAYRAALALLDRDPAGTPPPRALLLVELAEALTRLGEDAEARPALRAAAALARDAGDAELLARAALCTGERGIGVPYRVGDAEALALCEEALALLPVADGARRVRVLSRAAVEYSASDDAARAVAASARAVAGARRLGEPIALAHALSAQHAVFWRYGAPVESLAVASEIAAIGSAVGDPDLVAQGRAWRLYDLALAGDAVAYDEDLAAYGPLAESLRRPRYLWLAANARVLRALWAGRFAAAEAAIETAQALAARLGDATAMLAPGAQLFALRREQGRLAEQEMAARLVAARFPSSPVPQTFLALILTELGRLDEARAAFESVAAADFADLRREHRLGVLPYLSEVCAALGDARRAAGLRELLLPLADRVVPYGSSVAIGVGAHWLALLAEAMRRPDDARDYAEQAVARHATMDAPPWLARSRVLLARLLHQAGREPERARDLCQLAADVARALGMRRLAADADALLATLAPPAAPSPRRRRGVFRRDGALWTIGDGEGAPLRLRRCKGFAHIAALLRQPGRSLTAIDLAALGAGAETPAAGRSAPRAAEYAHLASLRDQLEEAERFHDTERAARLRAALDERVAGLVPRGRRRPGSTPAERARLNVTRTIADAIRRIAAADPALGRHFSAAIRTGTFCSYVPDPRLPIDWEL